MRQDHYDNTKAMLDLWAEWMQAGESTAEGYPCKSVGAPDARIHSFDDLEIEVDKHVVDAVNACVYEIPVMERNAILMHCGLMEFQVWRTDFTTVFDLAIESLYELLKSKVAI